MKIDTGTVIGIVFLLFIGFIFIKTFILEYKRKKKNYALQNNVDISEYGYIKTKGRLTGKVNMKPGGFGRYGNITKDTPEVEVEYFVEDKLYKKWTLLEYSMDQLDEQDVAGIEVEISYLKERPWDFTIDRFINL